MFTLVNENSKYFRVKRGQTAKEVEAALCLPVPCGVYAGEIISADAEYKVHSAKPFENLKTIAELYNVAEAELIKINGEKPVYPTRRIYVPK